jgi:NadR type nicotinamide-nucleotide adenylyltransferase
MLLPNAVVLMTALPPTIGHAALIDFASNFIGLNYGGKVTVLLNTRDCEPIPGKDRYLAISNYARTVTHKNVLVNWYHGDVPQNPSEHPDFWNVWRELVIKETGIGKTDFIIASESYGVKLAEVIGCKFIPFDPDRTAIESRGTEVRHQPFLYYNRLMPTMRKNFRKTVTIFGPESCGKTTMAKAVADAMGIGGWLPEWARPYLEMVGPEITGEKMATIVEGQHALQVGAQDALRYPITIQDTDLFSTVGYYRLWAGSCDAEVEILAEANKSDLYIVMNDRIPFEPDPLRYGGNVRETKMDFWTDLLDEFELPYHVVKATERYEQLVEVRNAIFNVYFSTYPGLTDFVRT